MAVLKRINATPAQVIELKGDSTLIGRDPNCHVVLDSNGVSRKHVEIRRSGDRFALIDLKSRNKTKLNGRDIEPDRPYYLSPDDKIIICDVEFGYYLTLPPETPPIVKPKGPTLNLIESNEPPLLTLDASRSSAMASQVKPEVKLNAILEIARNLSSELDLDGIAPKVLDSLIQLFPQAERAFLILCGATPDKLETKAYKSNPKRRSVFAAGIPDEPTMVISRSIVNTVINQKRAVLSQDAGNDVDLPTSASIADLKIRSVMCVPLLTPDGIVHGIIQLDTGDRKQFGQDDLDVLTAVGGQAAIAIQNARLHQSKISQERIERDLKIAEQVQKRFLPQSVPKPPNYEFFAYYHPTYEVGGDYYDFLPLGGSKLGIALGDVAGKGVAAALMMAKFSGDTRFCLSTKPNTSEAISELNNTLCAAGIEEKFMTMTLCILDTITGKLSFSSAGHPPIIVRHPDGSFVELGEDISGFPLGVVPGIPYDEMEVQLNVGDVVVIYSDGVTDSRGPNNELFDTKERRRLPKRIAETSGGPEAVGKSILQAVREYSLGQPQADDITLICFGRTGSTEVTTENPSLSEIARASRQA